MAHPDNRYRGLEGLSREEKASRRRQNQLFIHLNKTITTSTLQNIKQLVSGVYLEDGVLERCITLYDILKALDNRCVITVGYYEKLKELLKDAGVKKLVKDVEKAEHDIEEMTRRVLHDDPSYLKALKEQYPRIRTALQKDSTLAGVTNTLKCHKILDEQHQMVGSTPPSARILLNAVMSKRNKGLRAMRLLARALWDTGHEELACDILTTQCSQERGAGRDVHIPSSEWIILGWYLNLTENLPEPDLHLVLDHLVSKGTVSEDERAAIIQQPSRVEKVQEMLDTLLSGDREEAVDSLYNALLLAEQDDLAGSMLINWMWLERELSSIYRRHLDDLNLEISVRNKPLDIFCKKGPPSTSLQTPSTTRNTTEDRVISWKVTDSRHGRFLRSLICGQWGNNGAGSEQRKLGGYKAVIDIETVEEVLGNHAMRRGQTVLEILASMPDIPKESLFILNVTQRPDLKTKWKRLLTGEFFPDAKVLLFEGSDDQGTARGGEKEET